MIVTDSKKNLAPIAMFVYKRPDYLEKTVASLAKNDLAKDSVLWIFSDGARGEHDAAGVQGVREYAKTIQASGMFKAVHIWESPKNNGLVNSIKRGISEILEDSEKIIVIEDDVVSTPDFLSFMNEALDFYSPKEIGAISGYQPLPIFPSNYDKSVYITNRNCSFAWATWAEVWTDVDWDAKAYQGFSKSWSRILEFGRFGLDRPDRLRRQMKGGAGSWSILFGFSLFCRNLKVIYPSITKVVNIGQDGSGEHAPTDIFNSELPEQRNAYTLELPTEDERIRKPFRRLYTGKGIRILIAYLKTAKILFSKK